MAVDKQFSERPPNSDFQQQHLKAWQPLLTPPWVIGTFIIIGVIFMPVGFVILDASKTVKQFEAKYNMNDSSVRIPINEDVGPDETMYFFYRLTKFYQNHRRYYSSRSEPQLRGQDPADTTLCGPLERHPAKTGDILYPCGLVADSYFNDTFSEPSVCNESNALACTPITWTDEGIAWDTDVKSRFKDHQYEGTTNIGPNGPLPNVTDEAFIVWMRTAGLPDFMKFRYRMTGVNMKKGQEFVVKIDNQFEVDTFGGEKFIVISTASWLGGKSETLGWAYVVVGIVSAVLGVAFFIKDRFCPRKLGDMKYFNFHNAKR